MTQPHNLTSNSFGGKAGRYLKFSFKIDESDKKQRKNKKHCLINMEKKLTVILSFNCAKKMYKIG